MKNQIVCLSTTPYHPLPTRKQNVMNRLQNADILYFDPPVSILAPLKDKKAAAYLKKYRQPGEQVRDNITVYALPPVLPFFNKFRLLNRLNQWRHARFVRKKMAAHGFGAECVLWCYSPSSCDIVSHVPHKALVYDCVDRHSAYKGHINPAVVDRMERDLAARATQVFSTAVGLHETLQKISPDARMIPNGAAYDIFSKVQTERGTLPCPDAMKNLPHPVFGFVGMLQECIDYDLIERLAREKPEASVFMIGRPLPGIDLSRFDALKNVHIHGLVPQGELPAFLCQFDVCLNVFRAGALSRDVSPLKFYEYLATGLPTVSTREPLQVEEFADVTYIAQTADEFVPLCEAAAAENAPEKVEKRLAYGRACSWDERVRQMEGVLQQKGILFAKQGEK